MENRLLDVQQVSTMLGCGQRSVWRFRDMGKLPAPVTLGRLVKWRAVDMAAWIADGCPDCRKTGWTAPTPAATCCGKGGAA